MTTAITKINRHGSGVCCYLRAEILARVPLKRGDIVAVRAQGRCIVLERIDMEELARLRRDTLRAQGGEDGRGDE